ncbi:alpha-N-acetylglucosaminidase TIM-barrel domain-containing protein [Clostridium sardiniense]|uniref:alpha-N-acetylglucosaminidase TIM-barrel domain-containing protein n=1 Tax=Clostridium sardiniense TaxID=29369 RepID=UPI003D325B36
MKNVKKLVSRAVALTIVTGLIGNAPLIAKADIKKGNIKEGFTVTAKSNTNGHDVNLAMDGDKSTYWESSNHYRWIEIDLNGTYSLSEIKIFNKLEGYYNYNIYASSDGENFIKVAEKSDLSPAKAEGDSHNLGNMSASKIRVDVTFSSASNNSNIAEVEIYGEKVSNEKPADKPISVTNFNDTKWSEEYNNFTNDKSYANEKTIKEMSNMVGRVIGDEYKDKFKFEVRKATSTGNDVFEIEDSKDGKIVIRGNDGVSLASGFNYYLKNYCNVMYNPMMGSNLNMPEKLPKVSEKIVIDTPYEHRYALNFCTYSYTMAFWDWDEYEAFLDWAAMSGYNLVLDIVGQEEVLRRTLNEFGYSDEEVKEFISGPAYFAWFYMQNMTSFGGPLPDNWFEERAELGRKMHDRMQTYGINPVLQGYSGMVPLDFKEKNKDAEILPQGEWCGFDRPNMLKTFVEDGQRDYFAEVADVFYEKQKEVFGDVTDYYAVDPFHEGGNTGGIDEGRIYGTIQEKMIEHDKDSIWVIQHWQGNPSNNKVNGLKNKDQALILDLNSELNPGYKRFDDLGLPWVWNMLHNFGGRMGLDGQPERIANNIQDAYAESKNMKGIGITPEAINNSPIVYELLSDMIWTRDKVDFKDWTYKYIERRYGKENENIKEAWDILLETAYNKRNDYYQGAAESIINSRPDFTINSASTWGNNKIPYDKKEFEKALELFIKAYDELKDSEAFIYDFLDVAKQVLANSSQEYHKEMVNAYKKKDLAKFEKISTQFLELIRLQERILSTSPEFLVGNWIEDSRTMLEGADDWTKDLFEFNARALITTWGDYKNGSLKDYSNRQWAGLTGDLYLKRWETWINGLTEELKTGKKAPSINWHKMEYEWAVQKTSEEKYYPTEGSGENLSELATIAMEKFSVTNMEKFLGESGSVSEKVNIALGKTVESSVPTNSEYPTKNLTDGNTGTSWIANGVTWPASLTLDLEKSYNVDGIQVAFNQAAGGFPITYNVEVFSGGKWTKIAEKTEGTVTGTVNIDYKGSAEKVRVNLNSTDKNLVPELTEIVVYESEEEKVNYENVALGKPVTGTNAQGGSALSNITDGKEDTLWIADGGKIPSEVTIDLTDSEYIEKVQLVFEKSGLPFKFKVESIDKDGNKKVILDKTNNDEALEGTYEIPVNDNIKNIKVSFTGKANVGEWPGAWPAIAEVKALRPVKEEIESVNVALNKKVTGSNSEGGKPLSNITDGDENTIWVASGGAMPAEANVDLGKEYFVENLELVFEKAGLPFKFKVEVIDGNGNRSTVLDKTNNNEVLEKSYVIPVNKNITNTIVTITGKAQVGNAQGAWPAIAEIKAYSKPENVAINSAITPNVDGKMNPLVDGDAKTSVSLINGDAKEYVIKLDKKADISAIETIKSSNEALKYKIEYTSDNENWKTIVDKLSNDKNVESNLDMLSQSVLASAIRVTYGNENITLNELKVYKADVTGSLVSYIEKVQKIYDSAKVGEFSGEYSKDSKDLLGNAINSAKEASKRGLNSEEVGQEIDKLKEALKEFYKGKVTINRINLASLISNVEYVLDNIDTEKLNKLTEEERSIINDKINALKTEKDNAVKVYEKVKVTQKEIDSSYDELNKVLDGYIEVADAEDGYNSILGIAKEKLKNAVVGEGEGQHSKESVDELKAAIEKSEKEFKTAESSEQIKEITRTLKAELDKFEEGVHVVNKDALKNIIDEGRKELEGASGIYTPSAIKKYKESIDVATKVLNDKNASQSKVDEAIKELLEAQSEFNKSLIVNKDNLKSLIIKAKELINDLKKYEGTDNVIKKIEDCILEAEKVCNNDDIGSEEVKKITDKLNDIIKVGEDKLSELQQNNGNNPGEDNKPGDGDNNPGEDNKPGDGSNNPGDGNNKPDDGDNKPGSGNNKPGNETNNPNDIPSTGGQIPTMGLILGGIMTAAGAFLIKKKRD